MKRFLSDRVVARYFAKLERLLTASYGLATSRHTGDKGEDREEFLVAVLNNHLPSAVRAHRGGAILDIDDKVSRQVDIVVHSPWSPMLRQNKKPMFLAEGVYAAVEVKSVLTTDNLSQALVTSTLLKRFHRVQFDRDTVARSTFCTGLFAYTSRITKPDRVGEILRKYHEGGVANTEMIDFVAVNGNYCFHRSRSEDAIAFASSGPGSEETDLQSFRSSLIYHCSPYSIGMMLSTILGYVAPSHLRLDLYLYPRFSDNTDTQ